MLFASWWQLFQLASREFAAMTNLAIVELKQALSMRLEEVSRARSKLSFLQTSQRADQMPSEEFSQLTDVRSAA
eukprot:5806610-Amphidinium_carterae.3